MFQRVLECYFCGVVGMCIGGGKTGGGYVNADARHPPHTCDSWVIHTDSAGRSFLSSHTFPPSQSLTLNSSPRFVWSHPSLDSQHSPCLLMVQQHYLKKNKKKKTMAIENLFFSRKYCSYYISFNRDQFFFEAYCTLSLRKH